MWYTTLSRVGILGCWLYAHKDFVGTIFEKRSILDEWQGSEYAFVVLLPLHNNNNKEIWYRYP